MPLRRGRYRFGYIHPSLLRTCLTHDAGFYDTGSQESLPLSVRWRQWAFPLRKVHRVSSVQVFWHYKSIHTRGLAKNHRTQFELKNRFHQYFYPFVPYSFLLYPNLYLFSVCWFSSVPFLFLVITSNILDTPSGTSCVFVAFLHVWGRTNTHKGKSPRTCCTSQVLSESGGGKPKS